MSPSLSRLNKDETAPRLLLAPMEGVTDFVMRDLLTSIGGIDQCVTEFLRITDQLMPESVFLKNCPELQTKGRTRSGTPVFVQLLGGQAEPLALNAQRAVNMGALGIDLNFGCPAKTVNRHDGGATLLKHTDRLYQIVKTVREAVPADTPVTAKIRLGFDDPSACLDNAVAITEAGATWLTVHCRTKTDGYKPPAYWEWIPKIKEKTKIRIIANGEIWSPSDFAKCWAETNCNEFMIGRGALANPFIFRQIKDPFLKQSNLNQSWLDVRPYILKFFDSCCEHASNQFATARTKMWLKQLSARMPEASATFEKLKTITNPIDFRRELVLQTF